MEFKLCYVDRNCISMSGVVAVFFTDQTLDKQGGDDWNDVPYEHNAGAPYVHHGENVKVVETDYKFETPDHGYLNSRYSVDMLNRGAHPWLSDHATQTYIQAGCTYEQFVSIIEQLPGANITAEYKY